MFGKSVPSTRRVVISRPAGLHARPCLAIAQTVRQSHSQVEICYGDKKANGSEILDMLCLGAGQGAELTLAARGPDAEQVLDTLEGLFTRNFDLFD